MEKATIILKGEIAQRVLALTIKNLREVEIQEELDSLNKALKSIEDQDIPNIECDKLLVKYGPEGLYKLGMSLMKAAEKDVSDSYNEEFAKISNWDTSKCAILEQASIMNSAQKTYCNQRDLFGDYPMIGTAAIIDANIRDYFETLN